MSQRFRLSVVLRLREMAEESARIDLGHAIAAHQHSLGAVEAAERELGTEMRLLSSLQKKEAAAGDLQAAVEGIAMGERAVARAQEMLKRSSDALFEARQKLAEATRRREVIERLKERFIAAERREMDRQDAVIASEISSTRHALRIAGERR